MPRAISLFHPRFRRTPCYAFRPAARRAHPCFENLSHFSCTFRKLFGDTPAYFSERLNWPFALGCYEAAETYCA